MTKQDYEKQIDEYLGKAAAEYALPGLSVGLTVGEDSPHAAAGLKIFKAQGYADLGRRIPLEVSDVFHMASVSKLFVSTGILLLVSEGRLRLDDRLLAVLPWFCPVDARYADVTLRRMLSHTAGVPDVIDYGWLTPQVDADALRRYLTSEEVLAQPLLWTPGDDRFCYSNLAYELLGALISEISGQTFEAYIQQNIFDKLEMRDSTFLTIDARILTTDLSALPAQVGLPPHLALPHIKVTETSIERQSYYPYNRAHGPSSTLTSTLADLAKWGEAHIAGLAELPYALIWEPRAVVPNNGEHMGLGWFIREQGGRWLYGHEGTDDGFRASFWICPELKIQITVLSNLEKAPVKKISKNLFALLLE
jgi:CubicO group peptidase (beta-lactamase class C family)